MALMAAHGEIGPMPDHAVFADTGWEPKAVYDHLAWLGSSNVLPFPIHVVSNGNIRTNILARRNTSGGQYIAVPFFTDTNGNLGIGRRQCTNEHKLTPIMRDIRTSLGVGRRARIKKASAEVWIGISIDEAIRMRPARQAWMVNRHPLIEKGMSRRDCLAWLKAHDYPEPPKSSCIGCPFHSDAHWRRMRDAAPDEFADAVAVDRAIRLGNPRGTRAMEYMHSSRKPLDQADLRTDAEAGQPDLFNNECKGMCGV
jgi:hypothetical protein